MGDVDHAADRLLELPRGVAEGGTGREDGYLDLAIAAPGQFLAPGLKPVAVNAVARRQEVAELQFDILRCSMLSRSGKEQHGTGSDGKGGPGQYGLKVVSHGNSSRGICYRFFT